MTKIPIMDEFVRSVQSFGDAIIMGDKAAAQRRWENYHSDSFIGSAGMVGGSLLAAGIGVMFGNTNKSAEFIKEASEHVQRFGATAISTASHIGGMGAQAVTLGVPNPVSGALNGFASGVNRIVDEDAKRGKSGISWDDLGKEGGIGAAKGAASSGGIIPYAGTAVEKELRGEEIEFDHRQEWANWSINATLSLATPVAVKKTAGMANAGKIGVKKALAIGGTSGLAMGSGAAFISQEVQSAALERKMKKDGYKYDRDVQLDDGREYAVYTKKGMRDIRVPKPDLGDILAQGVVHGVTTAVAVKFEVKKQLKQNESLPENYDKRQAEKQLKQNESLPENYDKRQTEKSEIPGYQVVNQTPININYGIQNIICKD
ncbi:uncharacterized protein [Montipora capricornis]|uniref:uncharacterized protein n=1 Tax=Montipora capricornis TaxID=246305 RepID=UPI0035F13B83